jgi:hypothetical protein
MAVSDEAPNIKTEDIIVCCLVRAVAGWYMSMEQWWKGD